MAGPEVMLASATKEPPEQLIERLQADGGWWWEVKWDGVRAVVERNARGAVSITSRGQVNITEKFPDIVEAMKEQDFVGILDGEIIVMGEERPDVEKALLRVAQSTPSRIRWLSVSMPATFTPFDVLQLGSTDLRARPYVERRGVLEAMYGSETEEESRPDRTDGMAMWQGILENKLEGLVAKRGTSPYRPGRSQHWLKVKSRQRISALVSGVQAGKGSRGEVGALFLSLWDPHARTLIGIGKVGSGMSERDMRAVAGQLAAGIPTVVEVEYQAISSAGQLRMPVFRGIRNDIPPEACTVETLI